MRHKLRVERLEDRNLLAVDSWIGGNGNWSQASNWNDGVPTATSDVTINTSAAATITIQAGETDAVNSLTVGANDALAIPGGGDPTNPASNSITSNPGFESPVASNGTTAPAIWGHWGSSFLSSQYAFAGSQSLVLSGSNSGVTQTFAITPGTSYTASVYAMTPTGNPLTGNIVGELQLLYFDSSNVQISPYSSPNQIAVLAGSSATGGPLPGSVGGQGWNHFFTTATAPSNAATAHVQLATYSGGGSFGGAVDFDAIKFGPAPTGPSQLTTGNVVNSGTITVGPTNTIAVNGSFTQTSTGTLDVQLGGAPSTGVFGSMAISGAATLAGTLKADLAYGYSPSTTHSFTPITYGSKSGGFTTFALPSGTGYQFAGSVSFTNVLVSAAPSAAVTTTVSAATNLHPVATNMLGINATWWDTAATSSQTQQMATAAGLKLYRFPGGSSSDEFHFNVANNFNDSVAITIPQFVQFIVSAGGTGLVTLDYGSGSPQEAAAELAYLEGSAADSTAIGNGIEWTYGATQWQTVNWNTVAYWASLRGATPLAHDDGLNFLRIGHAAPFTSIKYWEAGNEEYGGWEVDHHGTAGPGGASTGAQHDPATYVAFAEQFATLATSILTTAGLAGISIGIDSGDPTGGGDNLWTKNVLTAGHGIGFVPSFISDHSYMQGPGAESDSFLLNNTVAYSPSILDWSTRYAAYQSLLQQTVPSQAASVQLMATEFNSVYANTGKQSTSLVNGLFIANSLGSLLDSGYVGSSDWDLRNGWGTGNNESNLLYGWRLGGDYGMLGTSGGSAPATGNYIAYPNYYALQLVSKLVGAGGQVVQATSSYSDLDTYAVMQANGDLDLLVINTNPAAAITDQFNLSGFQPGGSAQVWQYGKSQDTAQSLTANGASALANSSTTLTLNGANFSYSFPAYSMTVLDVQQAPTVATQAAAVPNPVVGSSTVLSALGGYNGGESNLTYTWATTGTPPAPVSFSATGSNAAKNTVATFSKAGSYTFQVTITDPAQLSVTSSVGVTVIPTFTSITVSLATSNLATTGTEQFAAIADDQFANPLTNQPALNWSVVGGGQIDGTGLFTPAYVAGSATIHAASGSLTGTMNVSMPGPASWSASTAGTWNASSDWQSSVLGGNLASPGLRGVAGDTVLFQSGVGDTANLDGANPTLAAITFNSSTTSYTIAPGSGGSLQFNNGAGTAAIDVAAGSHSITAGLALLSNLVIDTEAGSTLTIAGAISGAGRSLTQTGAGTLILSGANSFTGGTTVSGGSLIVENGASLGGSLTIGAGGGVTIAASDANGNPLVATAGAVPASSNLNTTPTATIETDSTASAQKISTTTSASIAAVSAPNPSQIPLVGSPPPVDTVEKSLSTFASNSIVPEVPAHVRVLKPIATRGSIPGGLRSAAAYRLSGGHLSRPTELPAIVDELLEQQEHWTN